MVFLALVAAVYWRLKHKRQNLLLLCASYCFYAWWDWRFLLLMATSTAADYYVANAIGGSSSDTKRKTLLLFSLALNFGFLAYFKYFNFFVDSFSGVADSIGLRNLPHGLWKVILPPAISFYTFQEVAYLVDVYQRKIEPAESLSDYALFISFFPHLIAGPIQRPSHLLPQVLRPRVFAAQSVYDGISLILLGMFRKCVIADSCAQLANAAFDGRMGSNGWVTVVGAYAFAFQIYGDFSGYSDIARGSAQLLGFHFMVNFRQPYLSTGLQDFWRRWHISLSTWLRDYLYIPLGGSRDGEKRTYLNLLLTMLIGGLWHGASWNFVVWGGLHGGALAGERLFKIQRPRTRLGETISRLLTFHFVCFAWIFFRCPTFASALAMLRALRHWEWQPPYATAFAYLLVFTLPILWIDAVLESRSEEYPTQTSAFGWKIAAAATGVGIIAFASAYQTSPFVYFQF